MLSIKNILLAFALLGLTACSTGRNAASTQDLPETPDKDSKVKVAKINAQLGLAYLEQKNHQRAKIKLLSALQQAPNIPEPWYSMAYYLEATGDLEAANQHYLKAIEVAPTRGDAHNNYGTYLCRHAHYQEAVQQFMLASKDPEYLDIADAYENAGLCSLKANNNKLAQLYFSKALMQDPERPESLLHLAELEFKAGKYKSAREKLDAFYKLSPPRPQSTRLALQIDSKLPRPTESLTVTDEAYLDDSDLNKLRQQAPR